MIIDVTSDRYAKIFGHHPFATTAFTSAGTPYEAMVACLSDPSSCDTNLDRLLNGKLQNQIGTRDFKLGAQYMVHRIVTAAKESIDLGALQTNGVLRGLDGAIDLVMTRFSLPDLMDEEMVLKALTDAAFGAGMKALGATGPVGKVIAAIVGFGVAIGQAHAARQKAAKISEEQARRAVFARMPPLQQPSKDTDDYLVNTALLPILAGGAWTKIFAPRFDGDEWVGVKRKHGYAFAPGKSTGGKDEAGEDVAIFEPGEGLGVLPGMDQITSVIQVSLDPFGPEIAAFNADRSYAWPIKQEHVVDVGQFYINLGRLGATAWALATQQEQSLDLFKIHVADLHARWKRYCDGGVRFLRDNGKAWAEGGKRFDDLRYVYGSSIGCAVGAWQCYVSGGTTYSPKYGRLLPGHVRRDMGRFDGLSPMYGCVLHPNLTRAIGKGELCLVSMYDSHIKATLDMVRARQIHCLRHSLQCAYVRSSWDAFKDGKMMTLLNQMRALLLEHPDRRLVDLSDVPIGEKFQGQDWKDLLRKAGVQDRPPGVLGLKLSPGSLEPTKDPAPIVPEATLAMPFADPQRCGSDCGTQRNGLRAAGILGGTALAAGTGYWMYRRARDRKETRR
ncbi:hypothetical protein [Nannocystis pusilla]|uniref:Uncharacterized protein n=1 Tax=Nannocystis pusilla TaxID=889268 RepID=A0ABS7TM41_9BACT|nr:hypothetical protein [Nannocystis pusilla]MBZ5709284.1 hypothetical protein [Nannocystis pusilla]